jgi:hypothetical protein
MVMKKLLLIFLFLAMFTAAKASHIVGGEMALVHVPGSPYTYKLELILYYDFKNGATGGDSQITARIFRKRDHQIMPSSSSPLGIILLPTNTTVGTPVEYYQPECSDGSIETNRVFYESVTMILSPEIFNDPEGYYIVWERCCRNYVITNIFSEDPAVSNYANIAGQIFYLEIPPVVKNGEPFINSSPRLFPPLSDYACPNRNYFVNFEGTDPDGDSLRYSIVTPLNSKERFNALPFITNPGPYDSVRWKSGFSLDNIMNGNPDLNISSNGLLTVKPSHLSNGLYVFAVRCEEFRDGIKIGEVRRDFQMLVQDGCPVAEPPKIVGKAALDTDFGTTGNLNVFFENTVSDADRCFEVKISDPDALKFDDNFQETVRIEAFPIGFKKNISGILPTVKSATITNDGTAVFRICLPECPFLESGIFKIGIVAFDNACTLPLSDTLIVSVTQEAPPNELPEFNNPGGLTEILATIEEGDPIQTWPIEASDPDGNFLTYRLVSVDFELGDVGMFFSGPLSGSQSGLLNDTLRWDPKCDVYDFTQKTAFELYYIVEDLDQCLFKHPDTTKFNLAIELPGNNDPIIDNDLIGGTDTLEITRKIYGDPIQIDITGNDADIGDVILLRGNGIDFNASAYGASFPKNSGNGTLNSQFSWQLTCDNINLDDKDLFEFRFMVVDSTNKCRFYKADTLHLIVHVEPPDNQSPDLEIISTNAEQPILDNTLTAILGSPISLMLSGIDADNSPNDNLKIELIEQSGSVTPEGFVFDTADGESPLLAPFTWSPECSIFKNEIYENTYTFKFLVSDDRCFTEKGDTITLNMTVKDVDGGDRDFHPPNVFSPNGDNKNAFFAMAELDEDTGELVNILPKDNCIGEFISIKIFNRWGKQVYESADRDFRWYGEDMPVGVYYYYLKYTNKDYKGSVSILRK